MNADQRERLRIILQQGILVRRGARIDEAVAEERARNLATIVELFITELREEITWRGPPPGPPPQKTVGAGQTAETMEMRAAREETMAEHAERIIR